MSRPEPPAGLLAWADPLDFHVDFAAEGTAVVHLRGELDVANADALASVVAGLEAVGTHVVDVDASGVTFAGCAAVATLARHARAFRRRGDRLTVVSTSRAVARVLDLTGLRAELAPSVPER